MSQTSRPYRTPGLEAASDPIGAIKFACLIDDHFDRLEFLEAWLHGDFEAWPEFEAGMRPSDGSAQDD